jgi:asparagine synthase (glutamine-hydrolysing)
MCGIVGIVARDASDVMRLEELCATMTHRGPDDAGVQLWPSQAVGLGHRRLAIIDLSARGRQPMTNEDETVWVVFNGEIYNFQDLRCELIARGHRLRTETDTEVVVHAYEEWGPDCVRRLRGMFAYAVWDARTRQLVLARDRFGIKPLFYYWDGTRFLFASEIKALLTHPAVRRELDQSALWDYFTYLYVPAPKTTYTYIRQVLPAQLVIFREDAVQLQEYWDIDFTARPLAPEEAVAALTEKLSETVRAHLVADVPVGVLLSGGIDSSAVAAFGVQHQPLKTFSLDFDVPAYSEGEYARSVARHLRTDHTETVLSRETLRNAEERVVNFYDQPFADASALPTFCVAHLARQQVKVALSGDGGDELFGGYRWYQDWMSLRRHDRIPLALRRAVFSSLLVPLLGRCSSFPKVHGLIVRSRAELLGRDPIAQYGVMMGRILPYQKPLVLPEDLVKQFHGYDDFWLMRRYWREDLDPWSRLQYLDIKTYLPNDILTKVDRASMATSLEVRVPLLDHELAELVASFPPELRQDKDILRRAVRPLLPQEILERPKKGFSTPLNEWLSHRQAHRHRSLSGLGLWTMSVFEAWKDQL